MAHFYGEVEGSRGPVSRLGSPASGIRAVVASWDLRVTVGGFRDPARGDVFVVRAARGPVGDSGWKPVGELFMDAGRLVLQTGGSRFYVEGVSSDGA